jgi:hypothetical protein
MRAKAQRSSRSSGVKRGKSVAFYIQAMRGAVVHLAGRGVASRFLAGRARRLRWQERSGVR